MKPIGAILRKLRTDLKLDQTTVVNKLKALGIEATQQKVSRWENDRNHPTLYQFLGLCKIYGIKDPYRYFVLQDITMPNAELNREGQSKLEEYKKLLILSGMYDPSIPDKKVISFPVRTVPLYDISVSAGTGQLLDSPNYEMIEVPEDVPVSANFCVRVSGNSMEPTFYDGDMIWIRQQDYLENGEIGIFYLDGNAFVKEYCCNESGTFLVSHNEKYAPIEVTEYNESRIFGKVVFPI